METLRTQFNVLDFGAVGDGSHDDAACFSAAVKACDASGGGRILIPAGRTFLCSPFALCSNIDFHVEEGATVLAHPDEALYTVSAFRENRSEGSIWIQGKNLQNVRFSGKGVIDGNGRAFMGAELPDAYELKPFEEIDPRPHLMLLENCREIEISEVTFANAAYWGLHFVGCRSIYLHDMSILNDLKVRNSDGIDFDHCRDGRVENCLIESGDDCICFKNRREFAEYGPCSGFLVKHCKLVSTSCSIKIGSENMDTISDILVEDCEIDRSNRGIGIQNRDEGTVRNVVFRNISIASRLFGDVWWGEAEPIYITSYTRPSVQSKDGALRFKDGCDQGEVGCVEDVLFENVNCVSENGVFVGASEEVLVQGVKFKNVNVEIQETTKYPSGRFDLRPCDEMDFLETGIYGFFLHRVTDAKFEGCEVTVDGGVKRKIAGKFGRSSD